ncbi:hypothetical protein HHK36_000084 [Tetracentron sinense]|uniref:Fungal lipase-type domain-containing protein n=1 Tax=Tetracentron sinense TaxID=13715 RepID=A0A835DQK0_TETSI|nr:hypothetical protein HHK36_000084 [Tetracentron sinense]
MLVVRTKNWVANAFRTGEDPVQLPLVQCEIIRSIDGTVPALIRFVLRSLRIFLIQYRRFIREKRSAPSVGPLSKKRSEEQIDSFSWFLDCEDGDLQVGEEILRLERSRAPSKSTASVFGFPGHLDREKGISSLANKDPCTLRQTMACTSVSISTSPIIASTKDIFKEYNSLRRSYSGKDICDRADLRRSYSDPHIRCSLNCIRGASAEPKLSNSRSIGKFPFQLSGSILPTSVRSFLFDPETSKEMKLVENPEESDEAEEGKETDKRANWVERLLELRSYWKNRQQKENIDIDGDGDDDEGGCEVDYSSSSSSSEEEEVRFDRESFPRLLVRVPWSDTKLYSQLAFLCNMAYVISELKAEDLRKHYDLRFVTSSLEKKAEAIAIKEKLHHDSTRLPVASATDSSLEKAVQKRLTRPSVAYEIAASAASYVQSRAKGLLSLGSEPHLEDDADEELYGNGECPREEGGYSPSRVYKSEVAAFVAASTMTAVVAAEETAKLEAARDLRSLHSSPCEWFICDDPSTYTRCFVIQGSDSLASWQANLFFEPTKFEGTDVLVHRGIYEAAKGIYEQFLPEILNHLKKFGERAKLQFTGHSLGGSLSLLVNLMLLARGAVKASTLLPVVTFGSPFVFCGGQRILDELGLDESHIHCVMMHRDIVPRAFSCNYPNHVAQVLKRLSGAFRSHPCLNNNKLLYSPMGKLFILQPDGMSSPPHPLLPAGSALYALEKTKCGSQLAFTSALKAFLNLPHPLVTLSDPTAYGSEGTILRDHDSSNYLKAMNGVLRQHTKLVARRSRKQRLNLWPLLVTSPSSHLWSHESNMENPSLAKKEVVTGV